LERFTVFLKFVSLFLIKLYKNPTFKNEKAKFY